MTDQFGRFENTRYSITLKRALWAAFSGRTLKLRNYPKPGVLFLPGISKTSLNF